MGDRKVIQVKNQTKQENNKKKQLPKLSLLHLYVMPDIFGKSEEWNVSSLSEICQHIIAQHKGIT